jgi:Arabinose-binding domain of AraC transcription regulator, N-term
MSAFGAKRTFRHFRFDLDQIQGRRPRTIIGLKTRGVKAMRKQERFSSLPTARGTIARAAYARALEARLEVESLLKSSSLTPQQIKNSQDRMPVKNQIKFLSLVAKELPDPFLGIHLAAGIELREMGLTYYVMASSVMP